MLLLGGWEQKQFRSQLYLYCLWTLTCHSIKCEKREKLEVITLSAHHWRPPQTSPRIRQLTTWSKNWQQQTPEKIKRDAWIGLKLCWGRRWTFYTGLPRYTIFIIIIIIIIVIVIGCADRVSRGPFVVSGIITLTLGWTGLHLLYLSYWHPQRNTSQNFSLTLSVREKWKEKQFLQPFFKQVQTGQLK